MKSHWLITPWFRILVGARCDLVGLPPGFLFIWCPSAALKDKATPAGIFQPARRGFRFGFWIANNRKHAHTYYNRLPLSAGLG